MSFLAGLKRRKVFQVAVAYAVVAWLLVQVIVAVESPMSLPEWTDTLVIILVALGFPLALVLAWAYESTPDAGMRTADMRPREAGVRASEADRATRKEGVPSIVVLPFENLSPDPDNAYFADGLTEELIADLSKVETLRVISRTSAMSFKDSNKAVSVIAEQLNVRYVLEGSVRRADNALRITAQLIDASEDSHLWAEKYAGTIDDIFELQEQLSRKIVNGLKLRLSSDEEKRLLARPIPDVRAYEYYLRALPNIYSFDGRAIQRAIRDLKSALEILGDNIPLLRGVAMADIQLLNAGASDDPTLVDEIEDCAGRIAALDERDASPFLLRGLCRVFTHAGFSHAVPLLREAYRRDRSDSETQLWLGVLSLSTGQADAAGSLLRKVHDRDPLAPLPMCVLGYHDYFEGRFERAAMRQARAIELGPEVIVSYWVGVRTFIAAGQMDRAQNSADVLRGRHTPFKEGANLMLSGLSAKVADMPEVSSTLRTWASRDGEWAQYLSDAYAFGGDEEKAFEWLGIALRAGFMNFAYLSLHDPFIAPFRDSAGWKELLHQIEKEQTQFESTLVPLT